MVKQFKIQVCRQHKNNTIRCKDCDMNIWNDAVRMCNKEFADWLEKFKTFLSKESLTAYGVAFLSKESLMAYGVAIDEKIEVLKDDMQ